jgi:hypothetical protein
MDILLHLVAVGVVVASMMLWIELKNISGDRFSGSGSKLSPSVFE